LANAERQLRALRLLEGRKLQLRRRITAENRHFRQRCSCRSG